LHRSAWHGDRNKPATGYDFETITTDLVAVMDALELVRPIVAGQSWAAMCSSSCGPAIPSGSRIVAVDGGTIELARPPRLARVRDRPDLSPGGTPARDIESYCAPPHPDWPESGIRGCWPTSRSARWHGAPWLSREHHMTILRSLWEQRPASLYASHRRAHAAGAAIVRPTTKDVRKPSGYPWQLRSRHSHVRGAMVRTGRPRHHAQHPDELASVMIDNLANGFLAP